MSRMITIPVAAGAISLVAAFLSANPARSAPAAPPPSPTPTVRTVAGGLLSPLSLDVAVDGTRYFSQNFAGTLHRQEPGRAPATLYTSRYGAEVGAVSERSGRIRFAVTTRTGNAFLLGLGRRGKAFTVADLGRYERRRNPDRQTTYGFRGISASCAAQLPEDRPATYPGIVETHPYATAQGARTTYVADAAGNSLLAVGPRGAIRTVAVLPPAPLRITSEFAAANDLPACVVGQTHWFESVPTDVEVGPDGTLFVSTLPGGPEDGSLGAAASIYAINPSTGKIRRVLTGLAGVTGLAVSPAGHLYAAELFSGRIVRVARGAASGRTFARIAMPGDLTWTPRGLFATARVLTGLSGQPGDTPRGAVVRFDLPR